MKWVSIFVNNFVTVLLFIISVLIVGPSASGMSFLPSGLSVMYIILICLEIIYLFAMQRDIGLYRDKLAYCCLSLVVFYMFTFLFLAGLIRIRGMIWPNDFIIIGILLAIPFLVLLLDRVYKLVSYRFSKENE